MACEEKSIMEGTMKAPQKSLCLLLAFLGSNFLTLHLGLSWRSLAPAPCTSSIFAADDLPQHATAEAMASLLTTLSSHLNLTQAELHLTRLELSQLKQNLHASEELSKALLAAAAAGASHGFFNTTLQYANAATDQTAEPTLAQAQAESSEVDTYTRMQTLPLGWSAGMAASAMVSPIGHACGSKENYKDLIKYMKYEVGGVCPDDQGLAQTLTMHGCEPLPRRRCFARAPPRFKEPLPLPQSLWSIPSDDSILWSAYTCKSFQCLNERKKKKVFEDCIDCFELQGREKQRWTKHNSDLDFSIDEVLLLKPPGAIRIGLDLGGGTGTFAVRMREKNVTIVTTSLNLNGPFNNFIAMRGVVPLYVTIAQRLPFFDNTLDIVHSMHVLSNWIPTQTLEFLLFDIDRVLRPGGLLWLDHFFCIQHQLDGIYTPMIERLGYQKLRWGVGAKLDRGPELQEVYLSAVLEKPLLRI